MFEEVKKGRFDDGIADAFQPMYDNMAEDISKQSKRLGGKMAVAQALYSRKQRDSMRKILGPECIFIVLNMSHDCQKKRVLGRHGDGMNKEFLDMMIKMAAMYEPAGADEENAYNVDITEDMNREDVIQKILDIVSQLEKKMPWKNGSWYNHALRSMFHTVVGESVIGKNMICFDHPETKPFFTGSWTSGDFGPVKPEVGKITGAKNYNIEFDAAMGKCHGVLNKAGTRIHYLGFSKNVEVLEWLNADEIEQLKEDRDPADAPICSYFEPKPNNPGKIVWLSGLKLHILYL